MKFKNLFSVFIQDTVHKRKKLTKKQCEEWLYLVAKNKSKITLRIVDENESKRLNKQFRNNNKATDILSFPFDKKKKFSKKSYIGDIIISYNFINKPKSQNLKIFKQKLVKTFIHGFLHLLGFDHIKNSDYIKMIREERQIYKSVILKIK